MTEKKKNTYIFCRDFWFGKNRQSESILEIYNDISNLQFRDITKYSEYKDVIDSNVIFIGELPERLNIALEGNFLATNTIFLHYHLEGSVLNELRKPMYSKWIYLLYFDCPLINSFLEDELSYQIIKFRLYLPPEPSKVDFNSRRLGYWNRTNLFCTDVINRIIDKLQIDEMYIYDHPNGGYPYLDSIFLRNIHVRKLHYQSGKNERTRESYIKFMNNCNIYLCPRRVESCGISNLEQLSRGCFMIGMDSPSINNYIMHKKTGFLIKNDFTNLNELENLNIEEIAENSYKKCFDGFYAYQKQRKDFIGRYFL